MKGKDAGAWRALQGCERAQGLGCSSRASCAFWVEADDYVTIMSLVGSHAASSLNGYLVQLLDVVQKSTLFDTQSYTLYTEKR